MGGVTLFDELFVFSGMMDRFDFKLVGKKEMYIQYNAYKNCTTTARAPEKAVVAVPRQPAMRALGTAPGVGGGSHAQAG
jgi:hypothetical protein